VAGGPGNRPRRDAKNRWRSCSCIAKTRRPARQRLLLRLILAEGRPARWSRATTIGRNPVNFLIAVSQVKLSPTGCSRPRLALSEFVVDHGRIDLALRLIAEYFCDELRRKPRESSCSYHRRGGGQSQFSSLHELGSAAASVAPASWAR